MYHGHNQLRNKFLNDVRKALDLDIPVKYLDQGNLIAAFKNLIQKYRVMREVCHPINYIKEVFEIQFKKIENELFWELLDKKAFGDEIL